MNWKARFKGDYIAAVEFGDKVPTLTIKQVESCKMEDEKKKREIDKAVIWFRETPRGWIYCKTSGFCLAAMFGEDDDKWAGKRVTLHSEMVAFGPDKVQGIRVVGSPDIQKEIRVSIKLPKRKAFVVTLVPTGGNPPSGAPAPPPKEDTPAYDHDDAAGDDIASASGETEVTT